MTPKSNNTKGNKVRFGLAALMYEHAYQPQAEFNIERAKTVDRAAHEYHAIRIIEEDKFELKLFQDGVEVKFQKTIGMINDIVDELVAIYKEANITPPLEPSGWEGIVEYVADQCPKCKPQLERIAAFVQAMQECCFNTSADLNEIAEEYGLCGKSNYHFTERYVIQDSKYVVPSSFSKYTFPNPAGHINAQYLFLYREPKLAQSPMDADIQTLFYIYMTNLFKGLFYQHFQSQKNYSPALLDEMAFRSSLERFQDHVPTIPGKYITQAFKITRFEESKKDDGKKGVDKKEDEKKEEATKLPDTVPDGLAYLIKCIEEYISETDNAPDAKRGMKKERAWLVEGQIGTGKTTLSNALFNHLFEMYKKFTLIPILVQAKNINGTSFTDMVEKDFKNDVKFIESMRLSCKIFKRKIVIIVDGLDECKDGKTRAGIIQNCMELARDNVFVVATSRPVDEFRGSMVKTMGTISCAELNYTGIDNMLKLGSSNTLEIYPEIIFETIMDIGSRNVFYALKTPMLLPCIEPFFAIDADGVRGIMKEIPFTSSMLLDRFYSVLMEHAKESGALPRNTSLDDIISAGKNVAACICLDKNIRADQSPDVDLLLQTGLVIGSIESPSFMHDIILQDMIGRAIASGEPDLAATDVFSIIKKNPRVGEAAIEHGAKFGTLNDKQFDLFEYLYDDNSFALSRLKALVWKARDKGPTPVLAHFFGELMKMEKQSRGYRWSFADEAFTALGIVFPEYELNLIDHSEFMYCARFGISDVNIPYYIEKLADEIDKDEEDPPRERIRDWINIMVKSSDPLKNIMAACPAIILNYLEMHLIAFLFPGASKTFFKHYFSKIVSVDNNNVLGSFINVLDSFIINTLHAPNFFPDLAQLSEETRKKVIASVFTWLEGEKRLFYTENRPVFQILETIMPYVTEDNNLLSFLSFYYLKWGKSEFITQYYEKNKHVFTRLANLFSFKKESRDLDDMFVDVIKSSYPLARMAIDAINDVDVLAYLYESCSAIKPDPSKITESAREELLHEIFKKIKQILNTDPARKNQYLHLIQEGTYLINIPDEDIKEEMYIEPWIDQDDLDVVLSDEKHHSWKLTPEAQDLLWRRILESRDFDQLFHFKISIERVIFRMFKFFGDLFEDFFNEMLQSSSPASFIKSIVSKERRVPSFEAGFWTMCIQILSKDDSFPDEELEFFNNLPLPLSVEQAILATESLQLNYLKTFEAAEMHMSLFTFYEALIDANPERFGMILAEKLARSSYPNNTWVITRGLIRYNMYRDIFVKHEGALYTYIEYHELPDTLYSNEQFMTDLLQYMSKREYYFPRDNSRLNEKIKVFLASKPNNPQFMRLYHNFIPAKPITWLSIIKDDQERSKQELEKLGIDLDDL